MIVEPVVIKPWPRIEGVGVRIVGTMRVPEHGSVRVVVEVDEAAIRAHDIPVAGATFTAARRAALSLLYPAERGRTMEHVRR